MFGPELFLAPPAQLNPVKMFEFPTTPSDPRPVGSVVSAGAVIRPEPAQFGPLSYRALGS